MPEPTQDLNVAPPADEAAAFGNIINDGTPAGEPAAPAGEEDKPDPMQAVMDSISALSAEVKGIAEKVNNPAAPTDQAPVQDGTAANGDDDTVDPDDEEWKPATWKDVVEKTRETAAEVMRKAKEQEEAAAKAEEAKRQEVDKVLDEQLEALEKANKLAPVKDMNDANDLGRQQRAELLGYAIKLNTTNLQDVAEVLEAVHQTGKRYDYRTGSFVVVDPQAENKNAPVGSSARNTGASAGASEAERAKVIRESRDLDDLLDKVGGM